MAIVRLPRGTNRTRIGPQLSGGVSCVKVSYDYEMDDGGVEWVTIRFDDVLQVEVKPDVCCNADDILLSGEVRVLSDGDRLASMVERWERSVGHHDWERRTGGANRFRHFTVYFDDAGCVDVIAATMEVLGPSARMPDEGDEGVSHYL